MWLFGDRVSGGIERRRKFAGSLHRWEGLRMGIVLFCFFGYLIMGQTMERSDVAWGIWFGLVCSSVEKVKERRIFSFS